MIAQDSQNCIRKIVINSHFNSFSHSVLIILMQNFRIDFNLLSAYICSHIVFQFRSSGPPLHYYVMLQWETPSQCKAQIPFLIKCLGQLFFHIQFWCLQTLTLCRELSTLSTRALSSCFIRCYLSVIFVNKFSLYSSAEVMGSRFQCSLFALIMLFNWINN